MPRSIATCKLAEPASSARAASEDGSADAAALPAVWATMHVSYGIGFLAGGAQFGPPTAGVKRLVWDRPDDDRSGEGS